MESLPFSMGKASIRSQVQGLMGLCSMAQVAPPLPFRPVTRPPLVCVSGTICGSTAAQHPSTFPAPLRHCGGCILVWAGGGAEGPPKFEHVFNLGASLVSCHGPLCPSGYHGMSGNLPPLERHIPAFVS